MISAQEARAAGPIAEYIAVSRGLQAQIWTAVFRKKNVAYFNTVYAATGVVHNTDTPWHRRLVVELEALSYEVSAEGVVSW
jgi:hypothetical protein